MHKGRENWRKWGETLLYADDIVVMANSKIDIQYVTKRWWQAIDENGMKIKTQKGKTEIFVMCL